MLRLSEILLDRSTHANGAEIASAECMNGSVALQLLPPHLQLDFDSSMGRDLHTDPVGTLAGDALDLGF